MLMLETILFSPISPPTELRVALSRRHKPTALKRQLPPTLTRMQFVRPLPGTTRMTELPAKSARTLKPLLLAKSTHLPKLMLSIARLPPLLPPMLTAPLKQVPSMMQFLLLEATRPRRRTLLPLPMFGLLVTARLRHLPNLLSLQPSANLAIRAQATTTDIPPPRQISEINPPLRSTAQPARPKIRLAKRC